MSEEFLDAPFVEPWFDQFATLIPKRPARAAPGLRPRDKYWLHMFDALVIAAAVQRPS